MVQAFVKPSTLYSSGHRGVDFSAPRGTQVYTVAAGQVIFAGMVAGYLFVTIDHGGDIKSTYSYLATRTVKTGDLVTQGQLIGTNSGGGPNDDANTFHFSMRIKNNYVDPMLYLSGDIPVRDIHLGPLKEKSSSLLDKLSDLEKQQLQTLTGAGKDVVSALRTNAEKLASAYENAHDLLSQMSAKAKRIARDKTAGLSDAVKKGEKELAHLSQRAMKQIRTVITLARRLGQTYINVYKKQLEFGIDATAWWLKNGPRIVLFLSQVHNALLAGIYDSALTSLNMTSKVLDQYFNVDWPMLLREIGVPISCLASACSAPITLACDPHSQFSVRSTSRQGYKGSGNGLMIVSGLTTSGSPDIAADDNGDGYDVGQPMNIAWKTLGYKKTDVTYYSYSGTHKDFVSTEPFNDLHLSAARMDEQVRDWKTQHPREKLDLITHSLGGSVAGLWLAEFYDPDDSAYPALGKVVMLAPPISGTQLASAGQYFTASQNGKDLNVALTDAFGPTSVPSSDAPSLQQLTEDGELDDIMKSSGVAKKVKIYAIRSASDPVVTAGSDHIDGIDETILNTGTVNPFTTHTHMPSDTEVLSATQHILEGSKVPCVSVVSATQSVVTASIVHGSEVTISHSTRAYVDDFGDEGIANFVTSFAG